MFSQLTYATQINYVSRAASFGGSDHMTVLRGKKIPASVMEYPMPPSRHDMHSKGTCIHLCIDDIIQLNQIILSHCFSPQETDGAIPWWKH